MSLGRILVVLLVASLTCLVPSLSKAEIHRYVDERGDTHYVDSEAKVPEKYRTQLEGQKPLPPINRAKGFDVDGASIPRPRAPRVEVFVTSWCPYCKALEASLKSNHIQYIRYDIEKDSAGRKKYQAMGLHGIPVTKIGDAIITGNDFGSIVAELRR